MDNDYENEQSEDDGIPEEKYPDFRTDLEVREQEWINSFAE